MSRITFHPKYQAIEFQIPNGGSILWLPDSQVKKEDLEGYEFVTILKPIYSVN
ncbi:MAG: hypothetical protein WC309_01720 [Candidatus Paceibacterota bacterium]